MRTMSSRFFSATRAETSVATSSTASASRNGSGSSVSWPALIFEKSRMSLMMVSSALPDLTITSVKVFWRGVELGPGQQLGHAEHAVHRRADLVAHIGEEFGLGAVGGFGLEQLRLHSAKARRIAFSIGRNTQTRDAAEHRQQQRRLPRRAACRCSASASRRSASMRVRARISMGCAKNSFWLRISR